MAEDPWQLSVPEGPSTAADMKHIPGAGRGSGQCSIGPPGRDAWALRQAGPGSRAPPVVTPPTAFRVGKERAQGARPLRSNPRRLQRGRHLHKAPGCFGAKRCIQQGRQHAGSAGSPLCPAARASERRRPGAGRVASPRAVRMVAERSVAQISP
ncbi:hypothetical protein AAFF_G00273580 [Aldrovandia affinis]|uniref:Uncharacterized protein n=1 Tax=Aldrovandia affinis TaxID=143900 RepID=A0AAD7WS79_9TELE|nr:hypothetical protein AAFF_G00273580 [Aldrovandia affinis]